MSWLQNRHPRYKSIKKRTSFVWDHYTGDALDKSQNAAREAGAQDEITSLGDLILQRPKLGEYLYKKANGESMLAYRERAMISRFPMHFQKIVASFVGGLFMVEDDAEREWGVLGDPQVQGTPMNTLWHDTDGKGTNWNVMLMSRVATRFMVDHKVTYYVEPGPPLRIFFFSPADMVNWLEGPTGYRELLVTELADTRTTIKEEADPELRYLFYTLNGWARYILSDKNEEITLNGDTWSRPFLDRNGDPRMPIRSVAMPGEVDVGKVVANGVNYLYNLLSDLRMTLRHANHAKMKAPELDDAQFEALANRMNQGWNLLNAEVEYVSPDPENAKVAYEIFTGETRDFYLTSMQQYADVAREVTPTELNQEENQGRSAFLTLFAGAVDEVENDMLYLCSQIVAPDKPDRWGDAYVRRKTEFRTLSPVAKSQLLAATLKGLPLPAPYAEEVARIIVETMLGTEVKPKEGENETSNTSEPAQEPSI